MNRIMERNFKDSFDKFDEKLDDLAETCYNSFVKIEEDKKEQKKFKDLCYDHFIEIGNEQKQRERIEEIIYKHDLIMKLCRKYPRSIDWVVEFVDEHEDANVETYEIFHNHKQIDRKISWAIKDSKYIGDGIFNNEYITLEHVKQVFDIHPSSAVYHGAELLKNKNVTYEMVKVFLLNYKPSDRNKEFNKKIDDAIASNKYISDEIRLLINKH